LHQWNGLEWWNMGNAVEIYSRTMLLLGKNDTLLEVIEGIFVTQDPLRAITGSNDDLQWWCMGWIRAYELTGDVVCLYVWVIGG
jgi:hypothetical protein